MAQSDDPEPVFSGGATDEPSTTSSSAYAYHELNAQQVPCPVVVNAVRPSA